MKKTYQSKLVLIVLTTILTLYLVNAPLITKGILEYTKLFIEKLFPTSLLLFTFSTLLINYNLIEVISNLLHSNSSTLYIIIMSMLSGFPSGPKYTTELLEKNYITEKTGNHIIMFTHFPNILFVLGPVNSLINNHHLTTKLLISLIISNLIIMLFLKPKKENIPIPHQQELPFPKVLNIAIFSSLKTIILIYGASLFFYLISLIIINYVSLSPILYIIVNGIFDLTKGIFSTTTVSSEITKSLLILFFISFGSISIHIQTKSILSDTQLNYKNFLIGRIISTILSIITFICLIKI